VPTERKIRLVEELKQLISEAEITIAASYQGIPVADQTVLRTAMREAGVRFRVVKNNLLLRAADDAGLPVFKELADGPTALIVGTDEPVTAARVIATYIREHPNTTVAIRNAVLNGELVDAAYINDLATIPPRDELLARIAGGLVGQVRQFAGLIQATTRDFSGLIEARAKQLEAESGAAA
jgi:large subunit ribosomal protein L10